MTESYDDGDFSHYTVDDWIDKLDRLTIEFYELRNAFNKTGNPVMAEKMYEFALKVRTPVVHMRVLLHKKGECK